MRHPAAVLIAFSFMPDEQPGKVCKRMVHGFRDTDDLFLRLSRLPVEKALKHNFYGFFTARCLR